MKSQKRSILNQLTPLGVREFGNLLSMRYFLRSGEPAAEQNIEGNNEMNTVKQAYHIRIFHKGQEDIVFS